MLDPDSSHNVSKATHIKLPIFWFKAYSNRSTVLVKLGMVYGIVSCCFLTSDLFLLIRFSRCSAPQGLFLWRRLSPAVLGQARPTLGRSQPKESLPGLMPGRKWTLSEGMYDTDTA